MTIQLDRFYKLIVGDGITRDAIEITEHQVTFDITKSADNNKQSNSASIEITNLSEDSLKILETSYPVAVFDIGYYSRSNLKTVFAGQIVDITTRKQRTDRVTQLILGTSYTELNHETISKIVPPGRTVKDVVEELVKAFPNISRGVYNGSNLNSVLINGYPLSGSLKNELDRLAKNYRLSWQVDNGVLFVRDSDRAINENFGNAYIISPDSGLIEIPYYTSGSRNRLENDKDKKQGVQFQMLINPEVPVGGIIKLEDTEINGWFRVDTIRYSGGYRGDSWLQEVYCTAIEKVIKKTTTTIPELLRRPGT